MLKLSLYTSQVFFHISYLKPPGSFSGIVVDSGYYETSVTPIFEGFPIINAVQHSKAGSFWLNKFLSKAISKENQDNPDFFRNLSFSTLEDLKVFLACIIHYQILGKILLYSPPKRTLRIFG